MATGRVVWLGNNVAEILDTKAGPVRVGEVATLTQAQVKDLEGRGNRFAPPKSPEGQAAREGAQNTPRIPIEELPTSATEDRPGKATK